MKSQPVISMRLSERKTVWHESIAAAAKYLGVNRKTLMAALKSESGLVSETDPPVYVDDATAMYDVELDESLESVNENGDEYDTEEEEV